MGKVSFRRSPQRPKKGNDVSGAAALNLDAKGRVAIPTRHRVALSTIADGHLVLTAHPHRCLLVYPAPAWEPIKKKSPCRFEPGAEGRISQAPAGRLRARRDSRQRRPRIDRPELRNFAQLDKKVWLVGQGSHFELWSDAGWAAQQEAMLAMGRICCRRAWRTSRCDRHGGTHQRVALRGGRGAGHRCGRGLRGWHLRSRRSQQAHPRAPRPGGAIDRLRPRSDGDRGGESIKDPASP